ncbi:MAG: hypothetical protein LUE86_09300 [Clostridiales bacterium]|nr:hypothetical protein [Clostridiales bacterium]
MFSDYDAQTRQMLTGNLLMIGCCVFYLTWWLWSRSGQCSPTTDFLQNTSE